ncbi:hypothetical protein Cva_00133 [Caedimonas varicaedens]|uniref:DUF29 domain-containing protein n=1 Tax=Caedimonas varicaedens TaxID=1629334 RepID=A0A0K8MAI5_9PROT|nr:hypothetical protein Cva_00133 [Caedimonas varicaedens]
MNPKHDDDFYGWTMAEAELLRQRKFNELDIEHLIEELESMGASEKREIHSRMEQLLKHLLKWKYQPDLQCRSWKNSIRNQRKALSAVIKDNPSLKPTIPEYIKDAYKDALEGAIEETGVYKKNFPTECPYTFEQIMDDEFYPE